ncbi:MAG TPA: polysaccharide deacetylase family protein [Actinomycetota bacterium]|nr:polysaccharide deacetylase family protein [Actinomycetota bacterium]
MNVWRRVEDTGARVALTFDDCDDAEAWTRILDTLKAHGAKAAFFPNGFRAERRPDLAARTATEGHSVGSHGWDHARLVRLPRAEIRRRLVQDRAFWKRIAGLELRFVRPPMGEYDDAVLEEVAAVGYTDVVLWDVDPADWRDGDSGLILDRVVASAREGSIVELHAVDATAEALPQILERLRDGGLEARSLDELLGQEPEGR